MAEEKTNISYMTEYLKHALEFEKYIYIWSRAVNHANGRINQIQSKQKELENIQEHAVYRLGSIDDIYAQQHAIKEKEVAGHERKAAIAAIVVIVCAVVTFLLAYSNGYFLFGDVEDIDNPLLRGIFCTLLGAWANPISFISGWIFFSKKSDAQNAKKEATKLADTAIIENKKMQIKEEHACAKKDWHTNSTQLAFVEKQRKEMQNALQAAKDTLAQIYAINVLPPNYRTLPAVATLYEYLETGRCNTIQGHGGIYDTYETEKVQLAQLWQLVQINKKLSRIEDYQRYIYQELVKANGTLSSIQASVQRTEKNSDKIACNTEISAVANQQSAAATQWLAWNVRMS